MLGCLSAADVLELEAYAGTGPRKRSEDTVSVRTAVLSDYGADGAVGEVLQLREGGHQVLPRR